MKKVLAIFEIENTLCITIFIECSPILTGEYPRHELTADEGKEQTAGRQDGACSKFITRRYLAYTHPRLSIHSTLWHSQFKWYISITILIQGHSEARSIMTLQSYDFLLGTFINKIFYTSYYVWSYFIHDDNIFFRRIN